MTSINPLIRFLVYSDIHHDRLAARCITLEDTIAIERAVHQRVIDGKFNFSVFCGDRFFKREPEDEVKVKADRALAEMLRERPQIEHYHLVGNHDWTKNSREWHTSESLKGLNNLRVLDEAMSLDAVGNGYMIHALPADVPFDMANYEPNKHVRSFNLFLFHGIVKGSFMEDDSDRTFNDGIEASQIDRPEWDFVCAGDLHVPQQLPFQNSQGGYIGSVLQRTRADADRPRGWLEVTATANENGDGWNVETEFVPTRNFFHRVAFEVGPDTKYEGLDVDEAVVQDVAVEVRLVGKRADVDRIADDGRWKNYTNLLMARSIEIIRDYQVEQNEAVVDMSASQSVLDDLQLYLDSGFADIGNLEKSKLFEMLQRMQEG